MCPDNREQENKEAKVHYSWIYTYFWITQFTTTILSTTAISIYYRLSYLCENLAYGKLSWLPVWLSLGKTNETG